MTGRELQPFAITGDLPRNTTVLEASAGTGKTWTIAALVARFLAEGHAELAELMIVTFGRKATDELQIRVRERLVGLETHLTAVLEGSGPNADDPVNALLGTGTPAEAEQRRDRIRRALADFDAATIATTHEFCAQMLDGLGVLGNREPDAVFAEYLGDLTTEVARDVFLRRYAAHADPPLPFDAGINSSGRNGDRRIDARLLADQAVDAAHTTIVPTLPEPPPDSPESEWVRRVAFTHEVRAEVDRRKRRARLFSYDDMLSRLRDALTDPHTGADAANRLRQRYRIVLVDEFQDTDVVQWEILRRAFHGYRTLILIGDPKQAIYAFRGADVYSYLDAYDVADAHYTLARNWRSDAAFVAAVEQLAGGAWLGHEKIEVHRVASAHPDRRMTLPTTSGHTGLLHPLRLRVVPPLGPDVSQVRVGELRKTIREDLVSDIVTLLDAGPIVQLPGARRPDGVGPLEPSDIAVLVRKNAQGEAILRELERRGVPAVLLGSTSVFAAPVAAEWLTLLQALEQPRQQLARGAALTCFVGWSFPQLAEADDRALTELAQRIRSWSRELAARGVAALLELVTTETRLTERLLGQRHGERTLTDLRHIGQGLHAAMIENRLGVGALVEWLREQIAQAHRDAPTESTRRLETDAEAVQILTLHRSKGLQFPVVYLPEAWDSFTSDTDDGRVLRVHDEQNECVIDVGGVSGPGRAERLQRQRREDAGEELRLLYVGLTRAQCSAITWWADSRNTSGSALHRLLFRSSDHGEPTVSRRDAADPVATLRSRAGVSLELVEDRPPVPDRTRTTPTAGLDVRTFDRTLDFGWRRTSYSALTAAVHGLAAPTASVGSEVEVAWENDEALPSASEADAGAPGLDPALQQTSPMQDLPSGVLFGTTVHAVLEAVDPTALDLGAELRRACAEQLAGGESARGELAAGQPGALTARALADALLLAMHTPLGPLADDRRLADIPPIDRLAELSFELPLVGGDRRTSPAFGPGAADCRLGDLVPLLRRHLPAGDRFGDYPERLAIPGLAEQTLRGYLTGSIDAVLRVRDAAGVPRYLVVDYKTNWLGGFDGPELRLADYTPARMTDAMMGAHYPLQALLYAVAVHRMLRWRQPGYLPETHLGGVLYLFVRGMAGPDTPRVDGMPCGVFSWRPAPELVVECSDLLDRGPRHRAGDGGS